MDFAALSLDISTTSTGWCFYKDKMFNFGLIKPPSDLDNSKKLVIFRVLLMNLLNRLNPTHVVIEDNFGKSNLKVLKSLAEFAGVAKECCTCFNGRTPIVLSNTTSKAYFKCSTKEELYNFIEDLFDMKGSGVWTFKTHNDITDAIAQAICFCDTILESTKVREKRDYGYLFRI